MKIVELVIDSKDSLSGIDAVSVVHSPAIEENFIALAKHEIELKEIDAEKKILMGAALVPNKQIYRVNEKTKEEYYIYFATFWQFVRIDWVMAYYCTNSGFFTTFQCLGNRLTPSPKPYKAD